MSATEVSLVEVPVEDVRDYEHIFIEVFEGRTYNKKKHPGLTQDIIPLFFSPGPDVEWKLLCSGDDTLFKEKGWPAHKNEIDTYLSREGADRPYQAFHIDRYNEQARVPLITNIDYASETPCMLPVCEVNGKEYFIVEGFSYKVLVKHSTTHVEVLTIDGKRTSEIKEECQRIYDQKLAQSIRHLSIHCEAAVFIAGLLANSSLTFTYDVELDAFLLKKAATARLFMMYARDKAFISKITPELIEFHTDLSSGSSLYTRHDNVTIEISATLLELKFAQKPEGDSRRNELSLLHKYNLDVLATKNLIKTRSMPFANDSGQIEDCELTYIDLLGSDYDRHKALFERTFNRSPHADFCSFADEQQ